MKIGTQYIIRIGVDGRTLVYSCTLLEEEDNLITFRDKFGKVLSYNKANIISAEEVMEGGE